MDSMETIKITFFQECEEHFAELESGLLAMEAGEADSEVVNAVFRAVHCIKGGARTFGLDDLVRFAHVTETTVDEVRTGNIAPYPDLVLKPMLRPYEVRCHICSDLPIANFSSSREPDATSFAASPGHTWSSICVRWFMRALTLVLRVQ